MTPADLDRLEALYEKATPGEWYLLGAPWLGRDMETSILAGSPDPHAAKFVCDFENFADDDEDKNGWNDADFIAALHNAFPALLEAARNAPRWIPVEERLPGTDVLVLAAWNNQGAGKVVGMETMTGGGVRVLMRDPLDEDDDCFITHWMPLPASPQKEGAK